MYLMQFLLKYSEFQASLLFISFAGVLHIHKLSLALSDCLSLTSTHTQRLSSADGDDYS